MNPIKANPLQTRDDFAKASVQLWSPLKPYFSEGNARVSLGGTLATFSKTASELEGFARPLFALAPLHAGGFAFDDWDRFRQGYANGTDPEHPEYWGAVWDFDQKLVESAGIGFGLLFAKEEIWNPQSDAAKANITKWLLNALSCKGVDNNWHFFNVIVSLALEHLGIEHDLDIRERALARVEAFYFDEGWYSDGKVRRFDHYNPFGMHFYGLLYAKFAKGDEDRCNRFRTRARQFAQEFQHWFDADGAGLAYGRSMTYRFAQASFWAALAFADEEALPWGQIRGLWARNMRWWGKQDFCDRDGVMSIGYSYPNLFMSESYNSPGSPYWSMKAFMPLCLPQSHPFWQAEEEAHDTTSTFTSAVAGTLGLGVGGSRIMLVANGECRAGLRCEVEKYGKFAYSTGFGFSVDPDSHGFLTNPFDNALALSENGRTFATRTDVEAARVGEDWLYSRWRPQAGVKVETWLLPRAPWHIRAHRITTDRELLVTEGGFAIERTDMDPEVVFGTPQCVTVKSAGAFSIVVDQNGRQRQAVHRRATPNTALYYPQTHVPHLTGKILAGTSWLMGAFAAGKVMSDAALWLKNVPKAPDPQRLLALRRQGQPVQGLKFREADPAKSQGGYNTYAPEV